MPLNQCEVNVLGCIRIHQASGEWRVEMTVFRFVVCGHTHIYIHTHTEKFNQSVENTRARLGKGGKSVRYRGDAAIEEKNVFHSYYAAYSVPIHRSSAEGAKVVFPFTEAPSVRRPVNTPVLRPQSGNHSSGIRHSIFNFVPPYTKSRHSREIRAISRYSTCYPQGPIPLLPRICQLRVLLGYEFTAAFSPLPSSHFPRVRSRLSENLLPTATQPCVISTLPPEQNEQGGPLFQSSIPSHRSPTALAPSSHPHRSFLYTRTAAPMESNVSPVSRLLLAWPRSIFLDPPRLPIFHRFLALLLPSAGLIRLNSRATVGLSLAWVDWMVRPGTRINESNERKLLDQSRAVASIQSP